MPSHEHVEEPQRRITYGKSKMLRLLTKVYSYLMEKASHSLPSLVFSGQGQSSAPCKLLKTHIKCFCRCGSVSNKPVFFLLLQQCKMVAKTFKRGGIPPINWLGREFPEESKKDFLLPQERSCALSPFLLPCSCRLWLLCSWKRVSDLCL